MSTSRNVAVLGGGLTGLSAAFHLARRDPSAQVTLYEASTRFGGWLRSERVEVADEDGNRASVLLEAAARTVRPNAKSVLELIHLLDLHSEVLITPRTSPAARARFISLPSTPGLSPLPSSLWTLLTTSLGRLILSSAFLECLWPANRPPGVTDESVDAFLTRRFGGEFARVLGSALVHGIYGADARKLSLRAAFPTLWEAEERGRGSVVWGEIGAPAWWTARARAKGAKTREEEEGWELGKDEEWEARLGAASVISFRNGMGALVDALVGALAGMPNVTLKTGTEVVSLSHDEKVILVRLANGDAVEYTSAISALPLPTLNAILPPHHALPHLTHNPLSNVTSLNLIFPVARLKKPLHQPGFGYLIPRALTGYDAATPGAVGMLGVVFDSASLAEQDRALPPTTSESPFASSIPTVPQFVKVTAMLGGPYPQPQPQPKEKDSSTSSPALLSSVLSQMSTQLRSSLPESAYYKFHRNAQSIPTYLVGHVERMEEMRRVCEREWEGRLKVAGAGVDGVSVGDCVKAGRRAAREVIGR